eukprot:gnl/TRDRNA2_/TRDRNA2_166526_c0_seq1.p1 gnl/TRDRNA2_/TRDRNA2_166526_c0~~gnl/TRDRNA2_/TRDRNA2_166526_c0_seq1.p1  ORF type:complete len:241 (+),score=25.18 gnl/TRDRNA2_/TRDRNA2_166526_c0_seq1:33-755(+)
MSAGCFWCFAIAVLNTMIWARGDCLVGDIMYQENASIGYLGYYCTGKATFNGTQSFCRGGVVVDEFYEGECTDTVPYCVQQSTGMGGAVCLSEPAFECDEMVGPEEGPCPMAKCAAPPAGCEYVTRYEPVEDGKCCPKLCHMVKGNGDPCESEEVVSGCDEVVGPERGNCPVAGCVEPPPDCKLALQYEAHEDGTCCPKLCNFVRDGGEPCDDTAETSSAPPHYLLPSRFMSPMIASIFC